jgi:hypothetical protein
LLEDAPLEQVIKAGIERLKNKNIYSSGHILDSDSEASTDPILPAKLLWQADSKLREIAMQVRPQLQEINTQNKIGVVTYDDSAVDHPDFEDYYEGLTSLHTLYKAVRGIAKNFDYVPNFSTFCAWSFLQIRTSSDFEIVLSFHGYSKSMNDIMAVCAFIPPELRLNEKWEFSESLAKNLSGEVFQFTNEESEESIVTRFSPWLDEIILNGLNYWRQQL